MLTWVYIAWSLIPVLLAIRFAFNSGRSRTSLQGWSLRWFWKDPTLSVVHDPTLLAALKHSLVLAALVMVIATPLGTALALGMRRWIGPGSGAANIVLLLPLVTPELVFAVGMFLLFTTAFGFIGLGTTAQAIGQVTFTLSWVVLIVRGRLATIGPEVEEAAADLGAPPLHVVGRVLVPLLLPAMAASLLVVLRAVDRRLRRQPVPGLGRGHHDRADAHLLAGARRADAGAQRAGDDHGPRQPRCAGRSPTSSSAR